MMSEIVFTYVQLYKAVYNDIKTKFVYHYTAGVSIIVYNCHCVQHFFTRVGIQVNDFRVRFWINCGRITVAGFCSITWTLFSLIRRDNIFPLVIGLKANWPKASYVEGKAELNQESESKLSEKPELIASLLIAENTVEPCSECTCNGLKKHYLVSSLSSPEPCECVDSRETWYLEIVVVIARRATICTMQKHHIKQSIVVHSTFVE